MGLDVLFIASISSLENLRPFLDESRSFPDESLPFLVTVERLLILCDLLGRPDELGRCCCDPC